MCVGVEPMDPLVHVRNVGGAVVTVTIIKLNSEGAEANLSQLQIANCGGMGGTDAAVNDYI